MLVPRVLSYAHHIGPRSANLVFLGAVPIGRRFVFQLAIL